MMLFVKDLFASILHKCSYLFVNDDYHSHYTMLQQLSTKYYFNSIIIITMDAS